MAFSAPAKKRLRSSADLVRDPVKNPSPQARAQRTRCLVVVEDILDDFADARVFDSVFPAALLARARDDVVLVVLVAGVHVDGYQREPDRCALAQDVEDLQKRPAVLPARETDHDSVAVLDHLVVGDGLGRPLGQPRLDLASIRHRLILAGCCGAALRRARR
jgi:hypothetical protein